MDKIPNNVRQEFDRLVPSSLIKNVNCFVLYDNHPRDERRIDITVCTDDGILKEYFRRDQLSSLKLEITSPPTEICVFRNPDAELFYLIGTENELIIASSRNKLELFMRIDNVDHFCVVNFSHHSQRCLQVTKKDDAVPLMYDENLKCIGELFSEVPKVDSLPIVTELKRKLIEARYIVQNNERSYKEYVELRHLATLAGQQKLHPDKGVCFQKNLNTKPGFLNIKSSKPWVKVCNKKLVIAVTILNEYDQPIQDIHMLINTSEPSLAYTTRIYKNNDNNNLSWQESRTRIVEPNREAILVAVIIFEDIKQRTVSAINLNTIISFRIDAEHLMPLEEVILSSMDSLGDQFDALSKIDSDDEDIHLTMVAIKSTSEKTDLCLRHISTETQQSIMDMFTTYLQMVRISPSSCAFLKSPYHALNGVMVCLRSSSSRRSDCSIYTRTKSQLLTLLHFINDAIPGRIIITPTNYIITAKTENLAEFTEETPNVPEKDYMIEASTVLNRTGAILEYLDKCIVKMNESKDIAVLNQIGSKIDLYACGESAFMEFKGKVLDEAGKSGRGAKDQICDFDNECVEPMVVD